jgi:GNAT superfamily N-acetyltransferase
MKIEVSPRTKYDLAFITDSFVKKAGRAPQAAGVSGSVLASLLEPLLNHWTCLVACPEGDRDTLLGWVLFEPKRRDRPNPVIAWVQVNGEWLRRGIGRALLEATGLKCGTATKPLEVHSPFTCQRISEEGPPIMKLAEEHGLTFRYRPYLPLQVQLDAISREAA